MSLNLMQRQRTLLGKFYILEQYKSSLPLRNINTSGLKWLSAKSEGLGHKPNRLEKYLLVWMKRYPSVAEVPKTISPVEMEKVRNLSRIKITIIIMAVTAFICVGMIYSGKQASKRGESVKKMNVDWHKEKDAEK